MLGVGSRAQSDCDVGSAASNVLLSHSCSPSFSLALSCSQLPGAICCRISISQPQRLAPSRSRSQLAFTAGLLRFILVPSLSQRTWNMLRPHGFLTSFDYVAPGNDVRAVCVCWFVIIFFKPKSGYFFELFILVFCFFVFGGIVISPCVWRAVQKWTCSLN